MDKRRKGSLLFLLMSEVMFTGIVACILSESMDVGISLFATIVVFGVLNGFLWQLKYRYDYQCPKCKSVFQRDVINKRVIVKEQVFEGGLFPEKSEYTHRCRECGHEWIYRE